MFNKIAATAFVVAMSGVAWSHASAQAGSYGGCALSAQQYQDRYRARGNASDYVCFTRALERELGVAGQRSSGSTPSVTAVDTSKALSYEETYCLDEQRGPGSLTKCLIEQDKASKAISTFLDEHGGSDRARSAVAACTGYTTGLRDLGSMENVNQAPIVRCIRTPNRQELFAKCVLETTGKPFVGNTMFWNRADADKIATCFNQRSAR